MFDVWKNVLAEVEQTISSADFNVWFADVELISIEDGIVRIQVPNTFKKATLEKKYSELIKESLGHNGVEFSDLEFVVQSSSKISRRPREITMSEIRRSSVGRINIESARKVIKESSSFQTGLDPKYTLDNFVVGTNNDLATAVAKNIIEQPGGRFNPFYLYASPGLGKTHLVQAIGNEILKKNPNLKVLYLETSSFYREYISIMNSAAKNKKAEEFSKKFQELDVLILDDIQGIIGKNQTQKEFFDIFNDFIRRKKQIIVTCDRLPDELKELDVRLLSRFSAAGTYDMQMPGFEDRCAIVKAIAERSDIEIEDEVVEYLAEKVKTNIRELEGEVNKFLFLLDFKQMTPLEIIEGGYIGNSGVSARKSSVSPKSVVEKVAKYYNLKYEDLTGKSRVSHIKNARHVAMYILSEELHLSTTKIATEVGVKDHTTVMHGVKKISKEIRSDYTLRDQISAIREKIYV